MQEVGAVVLVAFAVAYLARRFVAGRATSNCCGEKECPAAREMVEKLRRGLR